MNSRRAGGNLIAVCCSLLTVIGVTVVMLTATAKPQGSGMEAMQRLRFITGSWACKVASGPSKGLLQFVKYSFSPDNVWMTEASQDSGAGRDDWAVQLWGYDETAHKLVAYNFSRAGVSRKNVEGWVNGNFVSRRADDGITVSLKPLNHDSIQWIFETPDHRFFGHEDCIRRTTRS